MKKILSLLLAMIMVFSLATVAAADNVTVNNPVDVNKDDYENLLDNAILLPKTYEVKNGEAPAETFNFTFEGVSFKNNEGELVEGANIPAIAAQTISFDAITANTDKTATIVIDPDDYELGVYTYLVTEVVPADGEKTAGTTYDENSMYLVLTILRDEQDDKHYVAAMHYETATGSKDEGFVNTYEAGQLTVTKHITGNMADMTKKFSFTITFTAPQGEVIDSAMKITVGNISGSELWTPGVNSASYTNSIGDGESIVITNIPEGVTYTITEVKEDYTQTVVTGEVVDGGTVTGTIDADDADTAEYTNDLSTNVDTGIALDSAPYFLMLAVALFGMVALVSKKRYEV